MEITGWLFVTSIVAVLGNYFDKNRKNEMIVPVISVFIISFVIVAISTASEELAKALTGLFTIAVGLIYVAPIFTNLTKRNVGGHGTMGPVTHK